MAKVQIPDHYKALFQGLPQFRLLTHEGQILVEYDDQYWPLSTPFSIALACYRRTYAKAPDDCFRHLKLAHDILWPQDKPTWHFWTERRFRYHCTGEQVIALAGGASTTKSWDMGKLALLFWLANPSKRTVLIGSTTLKDLDARIWGYVKRFYAQRNSLELPGRLFTSPPAHILFTKEDTTHGMFAVPLPQGTPDKAISGLIGRHPDEALLVVIDESTDVNPAFVDAVPNWDKSPIFQLIVIGNSKSMFDPHGLFSTPINGWDTINPENDRVWRTKRGVCLYFDCYESPALLEEDPKKRELLSPFLFTEKSIEKGKSDHGENTPAWWRFVRGYWPPDDIQMTVLTPSLIDRHEAKASVEFSGDVPVEVVAGLDPAFSPDADECILRFARVGVDIDGRWVIDFGGEQMIHVLKIDAQSGVPAEYQILNQSMDICHKKGVPPENVAVDVWGTGSGLGAIIHKEWSQNIHKVVSIGTPSELPTDENHEVLAKDAYDRRVTELWFSMKQFVLKNHVRGLDVKACEQFCTRRYEWRNKKLYIETKKEYKERLGKVDSKYRSPDRADAACLIIDLLRVRFGFFPGKESGFERDKSGLRKFFDSQYALGYGPTPDEQWREGEHSIGMDPSEWDDGFLGDQFDPMEQD